jgi:DNA helicase MCM9
VRSNIDPAISTEAEALLRGYYQMQRRKKENISGHPTIRLLESLIRLTQAHARLLWMDMATERDDPQRHGEAEARARRSAETPRE